MVKRPLKLRKHIVGCFLSACALITLLNTTLTDCIYDTCDEVQWGYSYGEFDAYNNVNADHVTPKGIRFDPSGQDISGELIDELTDRVEACLIRTLPGANLSQGVKTASVCVGDHANLPIDRHSFVIKIANDWHLNCDKTQQLLPVHAGDEGCLAKGEHPTAQCGCYWRAGIRCPNVLIVTPNFYLYEDVLIRFVTDCQDPWVTPLDACASPLTGPLSDGTPGTIVRP